MPPELPAPLPLLLPLLLPPPLSQTPQVTWQYPFTLIKSCSHLPQSFCCWQEWPSGVGWSGQPPEDEPPAGEGGELDSDPGLGEGGGLLPPLGVAGATELSLAPGVSEVMSIGSEGPSKAVTCRQEEGGGASQGGMRTSGESRGRQGLQEATFSSLTDHSVSTATGVLARREHSHKQLCANCRCRRQSCSRTHD